LTDASRYPSHVFWSDEDAGYIATAPDLPGCSAFGETQQEALAELQTAIGAWTDAARAAGNPIPPPSQPSEEANYSGKVLVRMPKSLHALLAKQAKKNDASLNQHIVYLLTFATTQHAFQSRFDQRPEEQVLRVWDQQYIWAQQGIVPRGSDKIFIVHNFLRQEAGIGSLKQDALRYILGCSETDYVRSEHI
jgi:predicted RNase H-like HicB family nuclease